LIIYWIALLFNIGGIITALYIIIPEVGREFNYSIFRKYHIGWGYGIAIVYTLVSLALSLLSLLILRGNYFNRIAVICLISNALFVLGHFLITYH